MTRVKILSEPEDGCFALLPEAATFMQAARSLPWSGLILVVTLLPDSRGCEIRLPELIVELVRYGMDLEQFQNWVHAVSSNSALILSQTITLRQGTYRVLTKFD